MIPVKLTIQGLYSYQEKQTIDFTRLTAAGLFGIFGTVGSGKSSVLEAITFAVYGRTDRLNLSGDNRYYNMMNLKSRELLIDFIFETGKNQTSYRSIVKGKRNGKKFEDVKALDRSAYKKVDGEWIPIEVKMMEKAIGLSYDNFKRTIIIPQGQFQEFLQLSNKDRTLMMRELFNLGKYEFFYKVSSLESKNNEVIHNIEGQLKQLGDIDPEQIKIFRTNLEILDKELKEKNRELSEFSKKEEELRHLKELSLEKQEAVKKYDALKNQLPKYEQLENRISRYEKCVSNFKHLLDSICLNKKKKEEREKQIISDENNLKKLEFEISELNKKSKELKLSYDKRDTLKQMAGELMQLVRMKELELLLAKEEPRLKKGAEYLEKTVKRVDELKINKQNLEDQINYNRRKIPDLSLLSSVKSWYVGKHSLESQLSEIEKDLQEYSRQKDIKEKKILELFPLQERVGVTKKMEIPDIIKYLNEKDILIKEKQKIINQKENQIRVKEQLIAYSKNLKEGQPCPLCGSLHHPDIFDYGDIQKILSDIDKKSEELEDIRKQISNKITQLNVLESSIRMIQKSLDLCRKKREVQKKKIYDHDKLFKWEEYREENKLSKSFKDAQRIQDELKKQEKDLKTLSEDLIKEEKNKENYKLGLDKIRTIIIEYQTERRTIFNQLNLIDSEDYKKTNTDQIKKKSADYISEYNRIEKSFVDITNSLMDKTKKRDLLSGSLQTKKKEQEQDCMRIKELEQKFSCQLKKSEFNSEEEIINILSKPFNPEEEKRNISEFKEKLLRSQSFLDQLQKEIGNRIYDEDLYKKLFGELSLLKRQVAEKNREQGKITEMLKKLESDLKNQILLKDEIKKLNLRADNIKIMKSLFKASGFVNYISSVYLQNLCKSANERFFKLTRQKLSLEITPDNNFQVRDYLNGGKIRSVKTLSGGQTFQASLSLALSLADNIQKITESNQNFFFLDEGFGSLDRESLSVVFDTLKSLKKENRIVGVISHVEEMQQEIGVHLRIENDEERGSIIHSSWME